MKSPQEELQQEIRDILARQEQLRQVLEEMSGQVTHLQSRAELLAPHAVPVPETPPVSVPVPHELSKEVAGIPSAIVAPEIPLVAPSPEFRAESVSVPSPVLPPPLPVTATVVSPPASSLETVPPLAAPKIKAEPVREKSSLEFKLGTYWLVRIGIVMFLAALVFAGNYAYEYIDSNMGPAPKVAMLYGVGALLTGLGAWMERRGGKMLNFSRVLFAGGLSAVYYITYAAHYVPRLRVIENPILAGALLLAWAAVMAWLADRRKSQTLAVLSVLLAYFTSSITPMAGFTLYSNFVLTAAAVFFFVRHRWAVISWVGLVGTYASFGYWRAFGLVDKGGFPGDSTESSWLLLAILAGYWIVFTAATFSRPGRDSSGVQKITFLTANNAAFFGYGCLLLPGPDFLKFWQWAMGLGAVLLGLSTLSGKLDPQDRTTRNAYFSQGLLLVTVGLIAYFEGQSLALVMAMESIFLLVSGTRGKNLIARLGSYGTALVAVLVESWILLDHPDAGKYTASAISLFLLFNAWWVRQELTGEKKDNDDGRAWVFTFGGLWIAFLCSWAQTSEEIRPMLFSGEALGLAAAFYGLRMREATLLAQALWLAAFAAWLGLGWQDEHRVTPWAHFSVLLSALVLGHVWKWIPLGRSFVAGCCWQAIYALGIIAVLAGWILPDLSSEAQVQITAGLALVLLGYGTATRAWFLATFGQIFLWVSVVLSLGLNENKPGNWLIALVPILELVLIRRGWKGALSFFGVLTPEIETTLRWLGRVYQFAALILGWIWLAHYIPDPWRIAAYLSTGFALFLLGTMGSPVNRTFEDRVLLVFAGLFTAIGWGWFVYDGLPNVQNLAALLLIPAAETLARRKQSLPEMVRIVLVGVTVMAALIYVTRFTALHFSGNYWTVSWGLLAGLVFAAGFFLKHHWYRWAGLALLALAIGRVGVVDIWRFDTIYRILSLFVLSGMAIGLGFLYTRYQEKMKEWL